MGNWDFDAKKTVLEKTKHLKLNEDILKKKMWTVKDIDKRSNLLVEKIIKIFPYVKSDFVVSGNDPKREIYLEARGLNATGYLHEDNSVTVYADSQIRYDVEPGANSLKELREDCLDKEIIIEKDDGYVFAQNYTFGTPSAATDFILGGSNNGWQYWKDSSGLPINETLRS